MEKCCCRMDAQMAYPLGIMIQYSAPNGRRYTVYSFVGKVGVETGWEQETRPERKYLRLRQSRLELRGQAAGPGAHHAHITDITGRRRTGKQTEREAQHHRVVLAAKNSDRDRFKPGELCQFLIELIPRIVPFLLVMWIMGRAKRENRDRSFHQRLLIS